MIIGRDGAKTFAPKNGGCATGIVSGRAIAFFPVEEFLPTDLCHPNRGLGAV